MYHILFLMRFVLPEKRLREKNADDAYCKRVFVTLRSKPRLRKQETIGIRSNTITHARMHTAASLVGAPAYVSTYMTVPACEIVYSASVL